MKKTSRLIGAIALTAIAAFSMTACSSGGSGSAAQNESNLPGLKIGTPSAADLSSTGVALSMEQVNQLLDASASRAIDSDYVGYVPHTGGIVFFWKNKSMSSYESMKKTLAKMFNITSTFFEEDDDFFILENSSYTTPTDTSSNNSFFVFFAKKDCPPEITDALNAVIPRNYMLVTFVTTQR